MKNEVLKMEATPLLPLCDGLQIERISETPTTLVVTVLSSSSHARCPLCTQVSARIHSRYTRRVADLPCAGRHVTLLLTLHKFFCQNPACSRTIFAERLYDLVRYYARMTTRLDDALEALGFATGAEMVTRLAPHLGMQITPTTMLRRLRTVPCEPIGAVRVLGVDDFAWKKGHTYGTNLVNLEAHQVIDLLPDREAETLVVWLRAHPGVEIISRDRATAYADAAKRGAPQAIQVADRFHLLKNLREKLADLLQRKHTCLPEVEEARADGIPRTAQEGSASPVLPRPQLPPEAPLPSSLPLGSPSFPANERRKQERRTSRSARYEAVLALHRQGRSEREIAQTLDLCRKTVHRFLTAEGYPELSQWPKRGSLLDPYKPFLLERIQHGCWHGKQLSQEIKERGYSGSESLLSMFLADLRGRQREAEASLRQTSENDARLPVAGAAPPEHTPASKQRKHRRLSASRASWGDHNIRGKTYAKRAWRS